MQYACIPCPMPKSISFFFFFWVPCFLSAQHFDWAATGMGIGNGVRYSAYSRRGELLVAMNYEPQVYSPFDNKFILFGPLGDSLDLGCMPKDVVLVAMNREGRFLFHRRCSEWGEHIYLYGVTALSNGNFVVAYKAMTVSAEVVIFEKDGRRSTENNVPPWIDHEAMHGNINFDGFKTWTGDAFLFTEISSTGSTIRTVAVRTGGKSEWAEMEGTEDGGFFFSTRENRLEKNTEGYFAYVEYDCVTKWSRDFQWSWQHETKEMSSGTSGSYVPGTRATPGNGGVIYSTGCMNASMISDGGNIHKALHKPYPKLDPDAEGLDSYLNCISKEGKLLWVKYAESAVVFDDVAADRNFVYVSGRLLHSNMVFGTRVDTTLDKRTFISCLDNDGRIQWIKTFHAQQIPVLDADQLGHLHAFFHTMDDIHDPPLILGHDTLVHYFSQLIVSSFDHFGEICWTKTSRVPLASNGIEQSRLFHDDCGNVFLTSTMWFVGVAGFACFDAAFLKGTGYGGAPLIAKIQTTIPMENMAMLLEERAAIEPEISWKENLQIEDVEWQEQCVPNQ